MAKKQSAVEDLDMTSIEDLDLARDEDEEEVKVEPDGARPFTESVKGDAGTAVQEAPAAVVARVGPAAVVHPADSDDAIARRNPHACGLPVQFVVGGKGVAKKKLVQYLLGHRIGAEHRKTVQIISEYEREMFEVYSLAVGRNRAPKVHFVAALRLFWHGYTLNPSSTLDLDQFRLSESPIGRLQTGE